MSENIFLTISNVWHPSRSILHLMGIVFDFLTCASSAQDNSRQGLTIVGLAVQNPEFCAA
jgi:hypothetical protein